MIDDLLENVRPRMMGKTLRHGQRRLVEQSKGCFYIWPGPVNHRSRQVLSDHPSDLLPHGSIAQLPL